MIKGVPEDNIYTTMVPLKDLSYIERCLGLPTLYLDDEKNLKLPETITLFRMIACMPWLLEVFECGFDPKKSHRILCHAAVDMGCFDKNV